MGGVPIPVSRGSEEAILCGKIPTQLLGSNGLACWIKTLKSVVTKGIEHEKEGFVLCLSLRIFPVYA